VGVHDEVQAAAQVSFAGNPWKHDEDVVVEYVAITDVMLVLTVDSPLTPDRIGSVRLDETFPPPGCGHEIAGHRHRFRPGGR
jgi:hypothetical protein